MAQRDGARPKGEPGRTPSRVRLSAHSYSSPGGRPARRGVDAVPSHRTRRDPPQADEAWLLPCLDDLRGEAVYAARMVLANRRGLYALVPHDDA